MSEEIGANKACYGSALRKASRRISKLYGLVLAPCGLKQTQHAVLAYIAKAGDITISQLASDLLLERSALSRNLKPLSREGLVSIVTDERDSRMRRISLTLKGQDKLNESMKLWELANCKFNSAYGSKNSELLLQLLSEVLSERVSSAFTANV